jgi:hypothetical protein
VPLEVNLVPRERRAVHGSKKFEQPIDDLEPCLPFATVRAVVAVFDYIEQLIPAMAMPMRLVSLMLSDEPAAIQRTRRAFHPCCPSRRDSLPFMFAS